MGSNDDFVDVGPAEDEIPTRVFYCTPYILYVVQLYVFDLP